MLADIPTISNMGYAPRDQPSYQAGAWWGVRVKEGCVGEVMLSVSQRTQGPQRKMRTFPGKGGEACAKPKWHDLRVSPGDFKRKPPEKVKMWGSVCRGLCTAS